MAEDYKIDPETGKDAEGFYIGPTIKRKEMLDKYFAENFGAGKSGELFSYNPSYREKAVDFATDVIGALPFGGGGDYYDRKVAKGLFGDYHAENIADSIGVLDFSPLGLVFAGNEALREFKQAENPTDYILPTIGLGLSALEAYPLTKPIVTTATKPLRNFLSSLANKTSSGTLNPDITRRTFLKGAGATGVAAGTGALGGLLLKSTSAPIASNLDDLVGQFAKPMLKRIFKPDKDFSRNITPERIEELIDASFTASKDDAMDIRSKMFEEMNFGQRADYGRIQEVVTRSVQLRALQDGAKPSKEATVRFGAGLRHIREPENVNDVRNSVYETMGKREIKLIDDFYNSLREQGYTAQQIFDNPQFLNKFDITTKGSPDFKERLIQKGQITMDGYRFAPKELLD